VRRAAIGRYRLPAMPASANLQAATVGLLLWDSRTDARQMHGLVTTPTTAVTVKVLWQSEQTRR